MLAEFFDRIRRTVLESAEAKFVVDPNNPRRSYLVQGDQHWPIDAPAPLREHSAANLATFLDLANDRSIAPKPVIWADDTGARLVLDDDDRREVVTLHLVPSRGLVELATLRDAKAFAPRDLVRWLRFSLPFPGTELLLQSVRSIDFARAATGTSRTEHGHETLGRTVEARVQQADKVPESIRVTVPFWAPGGPTCDVTIVVGVHLNAEGQVIELQLLPDQIAAAEAAAARALVADIDAHVDCPVFAGTFEPE